MTDYMSTKVLKEFRQRLESVRAKTLPTNLKMSITGTNVLWANMDDQVVHTQVFSVLATSVMLVILLPIILGSVVLGVVGFAVSFLPIVITLGLMAWFGVTVNIATCLIGGAVIGVAVDDSIYMLSRIRDEVQNGLSLEDSIKEALTVTGVGIVSTSMILMGGFFSMTVSNFLPSAYFGVFFAVGICSALLADLLLLPIILNWLYKRKVLVSGHLGGTSEYV
jgi:predicted RND superfamily exporter protein